jgi:L-asparagine oxygenase
MSWTLIKGVDIGEIPSTPMSVDQVPEIKQACSALRRIAFQYGLPTAYKQEQDGRLIQHIFPIQRTESAQISSSSKIDLQLHTESAFHPYAPSFVILMCVREDLNAATTFALVDDIVASLDEETLFYLEEPLFVTAIDDSFRTHGEPNKNILLPILTQTKDGLTICFDEFFMRGKTFQAQEALDKLLESIKQNTKEIVLQTGDVLVLDNRKLVHGRKSFQARYDGTDRWLLRTLVVDKMPPETQYIYDDHMVITTEM